jgi:curli biogenesis system outer membrane secretion channel CsgG
MNTKNWKKIAAVVFLFSFFLPAGAWAANADIIRLGVVKFDSKAQGVRSDQASIISDLFGRTLTNSKRIAILERDRLDVIAKEIHLDMSGLVDPALAAQVGKLAGCQYMLLGSVTELTKGKSSTVMRIPVRIPFFGQGDMGENKEMAKVTIDARIIDVETSEVVGAFAETGFAANSSSAVVIGGFGRVEAEFGGLESRAIADAVNRLAHRIRSDIAEEYSYVVSAEDPKRINIDVGSGLGVQPGALYLVYMEGAHVYGIGGDLIGRNKEPISVLVVRETEPGFSTGEAMKGTNGKLVQRGDRVEPIAIDRFQQMVSQKKFPQKDRPKKRAYDDTAEQLFQGGGSQVPDSHSSEKVSPVPARSSGGLENVSTDPKKVIATYGLSTGDSNMRQIAHNGARKLSGRRAYDKYVELANTYGDDYLAAYQAGKFAPNKNDARTWYDRALAINPNYEPARQAREKLK